MFSEEGKKQLAKIRELHLLADRLNCTLAQLAIGKYLWLTDRECVCVSSLLIKPSRPLKYRWMEDT